jgi:hypothetical protein
VKFIINDQMVLLRAPEGPLAPYIVAFSKWAIGQGYARCSLQQRVRIAADFSRWLVEKSVRLRSVSSRHSAQYLRYCARRKRIREGDATALSQLLDFLRDQGATPAEKVRGGRLSPTERCAQAFEWYLREERALHHPDRLMTPRWHAAGGTIFAQQSGFAPLSHRPTRPTLATGVRNHCYCSGSISVRGRGPSAMTLSLHATGPQHRLAAAAWPGCDRGSDE